MIISPVWKTSDRKVTESLTLRTYWAFSDRRIDSLIEFAEELRGHFPGFTIVNRKLPRGRWPFQIQSEYGLDFSVNVDQDAIDRGEFRVADNAFAVSVNYYYPENREKTGDNTVSIYVQEMVPNRFSRQIAEEIIGWYDAAGIPQP